jgi:hypothetical protein
MVGLDAIDVSRAGGPTALARHARWALATSLVRHPNLARVRGLGRSGSWLLITSDDVPGRDLATCGLDRDGALAAVLQAARALDALHARGLAHGQVRAQNIRYAGGGLFRLVGAGTTPLPASSQPGPANPSRAGAPALAAPPEPSPQALASAQAADRAALGRVLDDVTRRHHRGERVPDPEMKRVVERLTGQAGPADSYPEMAHAIGVIEGLLSVPRLAAEVRRPGAGDPFADPARDYAQAPIARTRQQIVLGSLAAVSVLLLLTILLGRWGAALLLAGFSAAVAGAWWLARVAGRPDDPWRTRIRDGLLGQHATVTVALALIALAVLWAIGWLTTVAVLTLLALAIGGAAHLALDRPLHDQRRAPIAHAADALEELRWLGLDETAIEDLVVRSAGPISPGLVQTLLGPRAAEKCSSTPTAGGPLSLASMANLGRRLLDSLAHRLDARLRSQRLDRLVSLLRQLEEDRLVAEGVNLLTARRRARRIAASVVAVSSQLRETDRAGSPPVPIASAIETAVRNAEVVLLDHEVGLIDERRRRLDRVLNALLGPSVRLLAGALLLAGWVLWLNQNGLIPNDRLRDLASRATAIRDLDSAQDVGAAATEVARQIDPSQARQPLQVPGLPSLLTHLIHGYAPAVAGLLLIMSAIMGGGWRLGLFALAGAGVALSGGSIVGSGAAPIPAELLAAALGLAILAAGRWFVRR